MISVDELQRLGDEMFGRQTSIAYATLANMLNDAASTDCKLSAYGYLMWLIEHYGHNCVFRNVAMSQKSVTGYTQEAHRLMEEAPAMLLNAHMYVEKILSNVADIDTCFKQLEGMTFPYILYVLFSASGNGDLVKRYKAETEEQLRRYPSILDKLPQSYRDVAKEFIDADVE